MITINHYSVNSIHRVALIKSIYKCQVKLLGAKNRPDLQIVHCDGRQYCAQDEHSVAGRIELFQLKSFAQVPGQMANSVEQMEVERADDQELGRQERVRAERLQAGQLVRPVVVHQQLRDAERIQATAQTEAGCTMGERQEPGQLWLVMNVRRYRTIQLLVLLPERLGRLVLEMRAGRRNSLHIQALHIIQSGQI